MRDSARQVERLQAIRLRYSINTHLEDQGITIPQLSAPPPDCRPPRWSAC